MLFTVTLRILLMIMMVMIVSVQWIVLIRIRMVFDDNGDDAYDIVGAVSLLPPCCFLRRVFRIDLLRPMRRLFPLAARSVLSAQALAAADGPRPP